MKGDCPQQTFYRVPAIKFNPKRYGQTNTLYINLSSLPGDPKYTEFNVKSSRCNQALVSLEAVHNSKRLTSIDQWNMVFAAVYTFIRKLALIGNLRTTTKFTTTTSVDWEKTGTRKSVSAGKKKLKMVGGRRRH